MAIPAAPSNFSVTLGQLINTASWDSVVGATSYNLYWKKDKCPNCYFTSLDDWALTESAHSTISSNDGKIKFDLNSGYDESLYAFYNYYLNDEDYTVIIDIPTYVSDSGNTGVLAYIYIDGYGFEDWLYIRYYISNGGSTHNVVSRLRMNSSNNDTHTTPAARPTKYRIVRSGTTITTSIYVSGAWIIHASLDYGSRVSNFGRLRLQLSDNSSSGGSVEFDNLIVTPSVKDSGTKIAGVTSPYLHYPLTPDDVYCYEITAENVDGESDVSLEDFGIPEALLPPTNFSVVPGAIKNTVSWDSVIGADSYNIYWKKDKCPNCYFTSLDDFTITTSDVGESTTIVDNKVKFDIVDGTDGKITAEYNYDISVGDFTCVIDIEDYVPDDSTRGIVFNFRAVGFRVAPGGAYIDFAQINFFASNTLGGYSFITNARFRVATVDDNKGEIGLNSYPSKLKITRVGDVLECFYYTDAWHSAGSKDFGSNSVNIHKIEFQITDWELNGGYVEADNLIITPSVESSGTKITGVTSPYLHYPLTEDDVYCYEITAENVAGESDASLEEYGIPTANIPAAPVIAGAYDALTDGDSQNTITISEIYNATIYNIYWSLTSGVTVANGTKIADVTSPYEHIDLTRQNYYYVATAENDEYESVISNEICLKPDFDGKIFNHNDIIISRLLYQYKIKE